MKVFFDTNVWVAEALLGEAAERLIEATSKAAWRIFSSSHVLAETERVLEKRLGCSRRLAVLTRKRIQRRAVIVEPKPSRHRVPEDPADSPILQAALAAAVFVGAAVSAVGFCALKNPPGQPFAACELFV